MIGRGWKIAMAASLALNLFFVGLMAGGKLGGERTTADPPPARHARFAAALELMEPEEREALRALLRRTSEEARPQRQALRAAVQELDTVMARPDYDPRAVRAALARARAEEAALRAEVDAALIPFAAGLDPEERAALAPLLRKGHGRLDRRPGPPGRDR